MAQEESGLVRRSRAGGLARGAVVRAQNARRDAIIYGRHAAGEKVSALARDYGMCKQAIYNVIARQERLRQQLARKKGRAA